MPPIKAPTHSGNGGPADGEESEADVELSGAESDRSDHSSHDGAGGASRPGGDSSDADDMDSDDSSEMDESECERRRVECLENLSDLEHQFSHIKEQLYRERIAQVEWQLTEVRGDRSQDYLVPLKKLEENMRIRQEVAGVLRQLRMTNIRNKSEAEEQAALQNFESEKRLTWDWLHDELMEKIRRLEEDRHTSELSWGDTNDWSTAGGRSRSRSQGTRRKAVTVSGPYIVYMLNQQDILEDWTFIRKSLKRSPS